jgi:hypothetical protein
MKKFVVRRNVIFVPPRSPPLDYQTVHVTHSEYKIWAKEFARQNYKYVLFGTVLVEMQYAYAVQYATCTRAKTIIRKKNA